ncbi:hypothetical protein P7C70_g647, partial [Phenoliferia sp. Uapishka_3]
MQGSVFGSPHSVWSSNKMEKDVFPAHASALQKSKLDLPLADFIKSTAAAIALLGTRIDEAGGDLEMDLVDWVSTAVFSGAMDAMFGGEFLGISDESTTAAFRSNFVKFDQAFPLLASDMIPSVLLRFIPPLSAGIKARNDLALQFEQWVIRGMPGLEEGVIKEMVNVGLKSGWSTRVHILPNASATVHLQVSLPNQKANAPHAALWSLLYILQSPILPSVLSEISTIKSSSLSLPVLSTSLPILSSCLHETIRLATSSFSIRVVEEDFFLASNTPSSLDEKSDAKAAVPKREGWVVPAGSRIICATRVPHLDTNHWGKDAEEWDGTRFVDREGEGNERSKRAREVRGFGGGISICEGRHLATAELQAFLVQVLSAFDITIASEQQDLASASKIKIFGSKDGVAPKLAEGRVGMGVRQFSVGSSVKVRVCRRQLEV